MRTNLLHVQCFEIDIAKDQTNVLSKKDTFVRTIISTLRQKINDPLGKRQAK